MMKLLEDLEKKDKNFNKYTYFLMDNASSHKS